VKRHKGGREFSWGAGAERKLTEGGGEDLPTIEKEVSGSSSGVETKNERVNCRERQEYLDEV